MPIAIELPAGSPCLRRRGKGFTEVDPIGWTGLKQSKGCVRFVSVSSHPHSLIHISKMVLSTVKPGPLSRTPTKYPLSYGLG